MRVVAARSSAVCAGHWHSTLAVAVCVVLIRVLCLCACSLTCSSARAVLGIRPARSRLAYALSPGRPPNVRAGSASAHRPCPILPV
ncbi:uncharacterized protein C8Q71DRAFT_786330, partial [Rhodofomes roseus]